MFRIGYDRISIRQTTGTNAIAVLCSYAKYDSRLGQNLQRSAAKRYVYEFEKILDDAV